MRRLALAAGILLVTAASPVWSQRGPRPGGGPGPQGGGPDQGQDGGRRPSPPQFAIDACRGSSAGSGCTGSSPRGPITGVCAMIGGELACLPGGAPAQDREPFRPTTRVPAEPQVEESRPVMISPIPAPAPAPEPAAAVAAPLAAVAAAPALATPVPAPASSNLLPVAAILAAAAAMLFGLWKLLAQATAVAPVPAPMTLPPAASRTPPSPSAALTVVAPGPGPLAPPTPAAGPPAKLGPNGGVLIGGNYETVRELGIGGMGVVYEARDLNLDRAVALKKMRPEIGRSPRGRERFLSEARMVAKLEHPNIVAIHAIIEDGGDLYLVFEYVDGITLDELLLRNKFVEPKQALQILAGVSEAVDHAHRERVIHRDLKPANIMIDKSGRPKVMDFGIAHQAKLTISQLTVAEAFGTLAYMPPEQELGQAVRESDIYAFAAVTYELLTGGLPFPGPNFHLQKASMTFLRPSQADATLPSVIDPIFERAFQPEPKKRYPTTGEFVKTLNGALALK